MTKPYADREIWFLTGSQGLYGEETLRQVAEQSQEIARVAGRGAAGDARLEAGADRAPTRSGASRSRPTPTTR